MEIGATIDERYRLVGVCGHGSYGRVLRAIDLVTAREVALKEFVRTPGRSDGFLRELGVLFELAHPHIIACDSLVMTPSHRYLVYELMDAGSLRAEIDRPGADPFALLALLLQASRGVATAHRHAVIHRDLKPENILLARVDGALVAKVSDFGIAAVGLAASRTSIGSPAYMAPEQFYDLYDHRVDIYALGVIAYEIVCGRRPFYGSPAQIMMAHVRRSVDMPMWLPKPLARVLKKALAKRPERRFQSVDDFVEALEHALARVDLAIGPRWPADVGTVDHLVITRDGVLAASGGRIRHFDLRGRLVEEIEGDEILGNDLWMLVRSNGRAVLRSQGTQRRLGEIPAGARLALSQDGTVAITSHGGVALSKDGTRTELLRAGEGAVDCCFVGVRQQRVVAMVDDGRTTLVWQNGGEIVLPEPVAAIWGHACLDQLVARSANDRRRLYCIRDGIVTLVTADCGAFSSDGETFLSVTTDGELATLSVESGRVARTRWDQPIAVVAACVEHLAWVTRSGHLRALSLEGGPT